MCTQFDYCYQVDLLSYRSDALYHNSAVNSGYICSYRFDPDVDFDHGQLYFTF